MKLVTFSGESPAQALKAAQEQFGEEALVVNTKEIRKRSLHKPALYEVVVAVEDGNHTTIPVPSQPKEQSTPKKPVNNPYAKSDAKSSLPEDVTLELSNVVRQISQIAGVEEDRFQASQAKLSAPSASAASPKPTPAETVPAVQVPKKKPEDDLKELKLIKKEIEKLSDKMKLIQNMFWEEKGPKNEGLIIPHEFSEIYRIAKMSGMYRGHLEKIMQLTLEHMPLRMRDNSVLIKRYFREVLRKMILSRKEKEGNGDKKIMMLVGPTGVGKTTTLAKLAARFSFMLDRRYKVGIITLDTYRIGAVEQLMMYAKKMKLSIDTVLDPPEFLSAINSLKHCDYIFVDTVGSSPYDKQKIDTLKGFLDGDTHTQIDVNLVISANTKFEDLREIYRSYSTLNIDTIMVTKLDETRGFGNIFSLVHESRVPLSYFSTGQDVPNDLMVASSDFLVDCLLDGFSKGKSDR